MKYNIDFTINFKRQYRKLKKQGKDLNKLYEVIKRLANGEDLDSKYKDHKLVNVKKYMNCKECHIEPDWLLIYKIVDEELILVLFSTGSHSELFD